jgi:hypothetical protein
VVEWWSDGEKEDLLLPILQYSAIFEKNDAALPATRLEAKNKKEGAAHALLSKKFNIRLIFVTISTKIN